MVSLLFDQHKKTPSGYRYAPVAVVCRETSARNTRLVSLALWATPFEKTILNRFFCTDPTSNARRSHNPKMWIQPTFGRTKKEVRTDVRTSFLVAEAGFEPTTFGL